jgi:hypothetical protein
MPASGADEDDEEDEDDVLGYVNEPDEEFDIERGRIPEYGGAEFEPAGAF